MEEPRHAWVVVWATFASLAVIFGVAYSFAAFFAPFELEFAVQRAEVSLVFGLCGLITVCRRGRRDAWSLPGCGAGRFRAS